MNDREVRKFEILQVVPALPGTRVGYAWKGDDGSLNVELDVLMFLALIRTRRFTGRWRDEVESANPTNPADGYADMLVPMVAGPNYGDADCSFEPADPDSEQPHVIIPPTMSTEDAIARVRELSGVAS